MTLAVVREQDEDRRQAEEARRQRRARIEALTVDHRPATVRQSHLPPTPPEALAAEERIARLRDASALSRHEALRDLLTTHGPVRRPPIALKPDGIH